MPNWGTMMVVCGLVLASCGDGSSSHVSPAPAPAAEEPTLSDLRALSSELTIRGVVEVAHRSGARWGGEVALIRLQSAENIRVLVAMEGLEEGAVVQVRGTALALSRGDGLFYTGAHGGGGLEETPPLPVAFFLNHLNHAPPVEGGDAVDTEAALIASLPPVTLRGRLLAGEQGAHRLELDDGRQVWVLVVAEDDALRGAVGRRITLSAQIRPYFGDPFSLTTVPGIAVSARSWTIVPG